MNEVLDMDKKKKFTTLITILTTILVIVFGGYQIVKARANVTVVDNSGYEAHNNSFAIRSNATDYQKEVYASLNAAIKEKDEEAIATLIAENFVADFFTWTNKLRLNDVGGLQFINKAVINDVSHSAQDGMYQDMYTYLDEGKVADTLEVVATRANAKKGNFKTEEATLDAYIVDLEWDYKESSVINTSLYQKKAIITLVQDEDGLYSIVEVKNNEKK